MWGGNEMSGEITEYYLDWTLSLYNVVNSS